MFKKGLLLVLYIFSQSIIAQSVETQPLKVAVSIGDPPFIYKSANNQYYGFDISMMSHVCKQINRPCRYTSMPFKDIIDSVAKGDYDVGVSSLTITPERAQKVRFSIPYLASYCQFMVHSDFNEQYSLSTLQKSTIGYQEGSMFPQVLAQLGVKDSIVGYENERKLVGALHLNEIQIMIADAPTISYWLVMGGGHFQPLGKPFQCGAGSAIAVRPDQPQLLNQINSVLAIYLKSKIYREHISEFIENDLSLTN